MFLELPLNTLGSSFRAVFDDQTTADFCIVIGEKTIFAHTVYLLFFCEYCLYILLQQLLRIRSEHFRTALSDRWVEQAIGDAADSTKEEVKEEEPALKRSRTGDLKKNIYR